MKRCHSCSSLIIDTAKFCTRCGIDLRKEDLSVYLFCPECGAELNGAIFCPTCGTKLNNGTTEKKIDILAPFEYIEHVNGTYTITALNDLNLISLKVPYGVVEIGDSVFEGARVISVTLPKGLLKIGKRAFANCTSLTNINIPSTVAIISDEAFLGCNKLNIRISNTVKNLGVDALKGTITGKQEEAKQAELLRKYAVGSTVKFGNYFIFSKLRKDPIEWIVLDNDGNRALLLSKYALKSQQYHIENTDITWGTSTVRSWLNEEFTTEAFNESEISKICLVTMPENCNFENNIDYLLQDKIFLLSTSEANEYLSDKRCIPTPYSVNDGIMLTELGFCYWWLRSSGNIPSNAAFVYDYGEISKTGNRVECENRGIRPALWLDLHKV